MAITCNLYEQWISSIRTNFSEHGFDPSAYDDRECAVRWWSWQRRTVKPRKRQILRAGTFTCPPALRTGLSEFERAVLDGEPLWPWKSKFIDDHSYEDQMFNDFGLLHFHLGNGLGSGGYVNRTGELLFALVTRDSVHEVGIFNHQDWFELDLLNIVEANWPALLDSYAVPALSLAWAPQSADEVRKMRKANINMTFALDSGRYIQSPGGGQASDGTSVEAVTSAIHWTKLFKRMESKILEDIRLLIQEGTLEDKANTVVLELNEAQVSAFLPDTHRWILWKREAD
jgi:hypothetical protein